MRGVAAGPALTSLSFNPLFVETATNKLVFALCRGYSRGSASSPIAAAAYSCSGWWRTCCLLLALLLVVAFSCGGMGGMGSMMVGGTMGSGTVGILFMLLFLGLVIALLVALIVNRGRR